MFKRGLVAPGNLQDLQESSNALGLDSLVREFLHEEKVQTPWYIIAPEGNGRTVWEGTVLPLILASAISIPGQLAFGDAVDNDFAAGVTHFHSVLLGVYGLDLVGWCFVSFQETSGTWAIAPRRIVANYLATWFIVDLIAVCRGRSERPRRGCRACTCLRCSRCCGSAVCSRIRWARRSASPLWPVC